MLMGTELVKVKGKRPFVVRSFGYDSFGRRYTHELFAHSNKTIALNWLLTFEKENQAGLVITQY